MIKKYCPNCRRTSYSACGEGQWLCPSCSKDLSGEPLLPINSVVDRVSRMTVVNHEKINLKRKHLTLVYSK